MILNGIIEWQKTRHLDEGGYNPQQSAYNFLEELAEGSGYPTIACKVIAKELSREFTQGAPFEEIVDSRCDLIVFAIGDLLKLGVNPIDALEETLKEISSRQQDPEQKTRWDSGGRLEGEKWQKDRLQDPSSLYKACYKALV